MLCASAAVYCFLCLFLLGGFLRRLLVLVWVVGAVDKFRHASCADKHTQHSIHVYTLSFLHVSYINILALCTPNKRHKHDTRTHARSHKAPSHPHPRLLRLRRSGSRWWICMWSCSETSGWWRQWWWKVQRYCGEKMYVRACFLCIIVCLCVLVRRRST